MNPVSVDIKTVLVAEGIGTFAATSGWCINVGTEIDSPSTMITLYDTPGAPPVVSFDKTKPPFERPGLQIRVRGTYVAAYTKIQAIMTLLDGDYREHWDSGTTRYEGVFRAGNPSHIGQDDKGRDIWVLNYRIGRESRA